MCTEEVDIPIHELRALDTDNVMNCSFLKTLDSKEPSGPACQKSAGLRTRTPVLQPFLANAKTVHDCRHLDEPAHSLLMQTGSLGNQERFLDQC